MDLPSHLSGSATPKSNLDSPGLVFRGKTPRTSSSAHGAGYNHSDSNGSEIPETRFNFGDGTPEQWQAPAAEKENGYGKEVKIRRQSSLGLSNSNSHLPPSRHLKGTWSQFVFGAFRSLVFGVTVSGVFLAILYISGFFEDHSTGQGRAVGKKGGPKRGLRGRGSAATTVLLMDGSKIVTSKMDHHQSRVLFVPSYEPFTRRNVHHYRKHDAEGRLAPLGGHRNDSMRGVHVDKAHRTPKRREVSPDAEEVLRFKITEDVQHGAIELPKEYSITGESHYINTITGEEESHHSDANDYFGSAMARMSKDPSSGLTVLAVGAPGAVETTGVIYFMNVHEDGQVESFNYLTHDDDGHDSHQHLSDHWTHNTAMGWAIENIGDLDGDGFEDIAVGAIGYPDGESKGGVFIFFLNGEHEIKDYKLITTNHSNFTPVLRENARFGSSITRLGDLDGDGVTELAVGAMGLGKERGGVYILYMNKDGTVKTTSLIASLQGWSHKLNVGDQFGNAVKTIGDLDGDGIPELAVGADGFPSGEGYGAVWVLFLNIDGSVKYSRRLDEIDVSLEPESLFGAGIDVLGDLNGDGFPELLVGAPGHNELKGETFIVSLGKDAKVLQIKGMVSEDQELDHLIEEKDEFGWAVVSLGDVDGDGAVDIAVAAETAPGRKKEASIHMIFMQPQEKEVEGKKAEERRGLRRKADEVKEKEKRGWWGGGWNRGPEEEEGRRRGGERKRR